MMRNSVACLLLSLVASQYSAAQRPVYTDPHQVDADFAYQGEYAGTVTTQEGDIRLGVQVIALGKGQFRAVAHIGGLPGNGPNAKEEYQADGTLKEGVVTFSSEQATASIADSMMTLKDPSGSTLGTLKKVARRSPTLGKAPPSDATVLFDASSAKAFENGRMTEDGLLMPGTTSKQTFADHHLHIEFRVPYQPQDRGQGRGNSGVYLQGRYEVQILDSFGLEGRNNECGGIYERRDPDLNMCYPPLSWQTYDIDFTAARYDESGRLTANARLTVRHNGVVIHDDFELPSDAPTRAAPVKAGPSPGPVYLQDHGCPVRFRNIWIVEKP